MTLREECIPADVLRQCLMPCMCSPAVEELIALGADVAVTVGQQHLEKGLLPDLGPDFWELKRQNLLTVHKAYEAVYNSLYGLIHLAVSIQYSCHVVYFGLCVRPERSMLQEKHVCMPCEKHQSDLYSQVPCSCR